MKFKVCILDHTLEKPMYIFYCYVKHSLFTNRYVFNEPIPLLKETIADRVPSLKLADQNIEMFVLGKVRRAK